VDVGEPVFGLAGNPEAGADQREEDGSEEWTNRGFQKRLYKWQA
jgi:hypothetical protein